MSHRRDFPVGSRVELHPATDDWMRGDRYGDVVGYGRKSAKFGGHHPIKVKLDRSGRVKRYHPANLTVIETAEERKRRNPYSRRARYRHKRLRSPKRFVPGTMRLTKRRRGVRVVVGKLKGERRRVKRGPRKGRPVLTAQAVLTRKRGRNPTLAVFGNPPPRVRGVLSWDVQAVLYRHATDKQDYVHPFGKGVTVQNKQDGSTVVRAAVTARSGVRAFLLDDGSVLLRHPTKRLWGDF